MSSETKYLNSNYEDFFEKSLSKTDPDLFKAINDELIRQQNHIELNCFRKYSFSSCIRSSRFSFNK